MAFLEARISTAVRRGTSGGPTQLRNKVYDGVGRLAVQQFLRAYPLHTYTFDFGNKEFDDAEEIRNFFYVVAFTPYEGFRVRDWNDYQLTQQNSNLTLITGATYQINRLYTAGPATFVRPIYKTETSTEIIYRTRSAVVSVASASVDETTGIATIAGHVGGDTYTCEANFDVPVTFKDDAALARIGLDGNVAAILQAIGEIELEEIPVV